MTNKNDLNLSHLIFGVAGAAIGASVVNNQVQEAKKSRAERDNPEEVSEVCRAVWDALDDCELDDRNLTEDDYVRDLAGYLSDETGFEVEIRPDTREGQPDILVEDCLAIEVKINPRKSERDRCVGQCAAYSREWVTWIVVVDAGASVVGDLENLLADKGLEKIEVWPFD
jgi:hypothetical protein